MVTLFHVDCSKRYDKYSSVGLQFAVDLPRMEFLVDRQDLGKDLCLAFVRKRDLR